jgi:glycosyltransferase involved in cell wall biosynthesis
MTNQVHKILCVHSGGGTLRGSEWALLDILQELLALQKQILLLCDQKPLFEKARELGLDCELIPYGEIMIDSPEIAVHPLQLAKANLAVAKKIRSFNPDIIYCNGGRALQMAIFAAKFKRRPTVVHLHSPYSKRYLYGYGTTSANLVIHCSENIRIQHEQKVAFKRSVALKNAVMVENAPALEAAFKQPNKPPILGFFGSLIPRKGLDILIDAVHLTLTEGVDCRLKIGGHEQNDSYRQQVKKLGIEKQVDFIGEVPRGNIATFFADIDIHILPSRSDAMPLSIIEAAVCGVPSIAHDIGGISESLLGGALGILYRDNNAANLSSLISGAIKDGAWLSAEKSRQIATLAREEFSLANNAKKLTAFFESVMT